MFDIIQGKDTEVKTLDLGTTKNVVVVGKVQSGKTEYIINLIKETLNNNKVPILIASDRLGVLDQYKTRFSIELTKLLINIDSVTNFKNNYENPVVYVSILSIVRLKKIKEIIYYGGINHHKEFILIIDEGDLSIKNISCMLEKIQRKMDNCGVFLKRVFITATPFSITNSIAISSNIEKYIIIPPYRKGFIYRDYTHMDIIYTKNIKKISTSDNLNIIKIASYIKKELIDVKISNQQPNIGLMKIFHNNNDKHEFAKKLNKHIKNLNIIVYTGKGSILYVNKKSIAIGKQGLCIAQTIQKLKNEKNNKPILIISYNMASRSQTFKSIDHEWILTHFFIDLPNNSSTEQTIQALRCNGQYKVSDPLIKVYVSKKTHDRIMKLMYNNDLYIDECYKMHHIDNSNIRDCIKDINFIKVSNFKMCGRKGIDDTKVIKSNGNGVTKNYNDAINLAKILVKENDCLTYENVTENYLIIPKETIINTICQYKKYDPNDNENIYTKLKNIIEESKTFKGLTSKQQNFLRKIIIDHVKDFKNIDKSCQIGYYHERSKNLNKINHLKHDEYKSQTVCELLSNGDISTMIYKKNYYKYPEKYENKVLIWRNTNGNYHLCVNKPKANYTYISLNHV
jgi:hypothetical protein